MQESMGAIADRSHEKLGASDLAIVEFRRVMVKAVRDFMATKKQLLSWGFLVAALKSVGVA